MQSENLAGLAEVALRQHDVQRAVELYKLAAQQETLAINFIDPSKVRTLGITAVSAASLWYKAGEYQQSQIVIYRALATGTLPLFAVDELQGLLQSIWYEETLRKSGVQFTPGEVLVSVSGGEIVTGGAPLDLILRKVDEIGRLFYRTIEMLLHKPFRRRGAPSPEIQEQFRPWLFQAPAGSYQFAVRIEKPKQLSLFPDDGPTIDLITNSFLNIVRASAEDPQGQLAELVPNREYREIFLKLTRNLAPTGKVFGRLDIKPSSDLVTTPIALLPASREVISGALRSPELRPKEPDDVKEIQIRGMLRGLQLDNDWIEVNQSGPEQRTIRIFEAGDAVDDLIGPMVNHQVIVSVVERSSGRFAFRDIQTEE